MVDQADTTSLPDELAALFPEGGNGRTLPPDLPPGELVWADESFARYRLSTVRPALWLSHEPAEAGTWARYRALHPETGLWPLLLRPSDLQGGEPWETGELAPEPVSRVDRHDAGTLMAEWWAESAAPSGGGHDVSEQLLPFGPDFPGLADRAEPDRPPEEVADWLAGELTDGVARLGLVAASRGADALAQVGWMGPVNYSERTAPLSAILRSWEDRFGVRVVRLGFDTLDLSVSAPPKTPEHALAVAAEHWSFCPDSIDQGVGSLGDYARQIVGHHSWTFWWE